MTRSTLLAITLAALIGMVAGLLGMVAGLLKILFEQVCDVDPALLGPRWQRRGA